MMLLLRFLFLIIFNLGCFNLIAQTLNETKVDSIINHHKDFKTINDVINESKYNDFDKSYFYHAYASILNKQGSFSLSLIAINKAISIRKRVSDIKYLKKSLFNKGFYLKNKGIYYESLKSFEDLSKLPNEDRLTMKAYSELMSIYVKLGDYEKSINLFKRSTEYYKNKNQLENLYKNYMRISRVYASMDTQKYSDIIIDYLSKVDSLKQFTNVSTKDQAIISTRLGIVYRRIDNFNRSLENYSKALALNIKLKDTNSIARTYNNIGYLYLKKNDLIKAKTNFDTSSQYITNDNRLKSILLDNYASYYLALNEFNTAEQYYSKAFGSLLNQNEVKTPSLEQLSVSNSKLYFFDIILNSANFYTDWYKAEGNIQHLNLALQDFKLADELIDIIRFDASENVSKLFWREKGASLYLKAIEVCHLLNSIDDAYYFMEKNKALLLLENLSDQEAKSLVRLPESLVERDFMFKQRVVEAEERFANGITKNTNEVFDIKREYEQFKDSIAEAYPEYAKLKRELPILSLQEHKALNLTDSKATVQYILGEEAGYGLVLTEESSSLFKINDASRLNKKLDTLSQLLHKPFHKDKDVVEYSQVAHEVFKLVLPEQDYYKIKGKTITFSADSRLQTIPFEALVTNSSNPPNYLIYTNRINYVYSFSYLAFNAKKDRQADELFLGVAPQHFVDSNLVTLPNAADEVSAINSILEGHTIFKTEAKKQDVIEKINDYKILHFATHSGLNDADQPWLAFHDSSMKLNELYTLRNQAELVVLSACKTSQGELKSGEGLMSLSRGFLHSGTNTVISSLWNINDKTTKTLMHKFYTNIKNNNSKSEALHLAKLAYLNEHSGTLVSPFYWSSFVLIGEADKEIEVFSNSYPSFYFYVILIFILFVIIILLKKFNKFNG